MTLMFLYKLLIAFICFHDNHERKGKEEVTYEVNYKGKGCSIEN